MADWEYDAVYPGRVVYESPRTLKTPYEDGREFVREKHTKIVRVIREIHAEDQTNITLRLDFFKTKRLATSFTMKSRDPTDATDITVRFADVPRLLWQSLDTYVVEFVFREVVT